MDYFKNVVEYFDELYPGSEVQKSFFLQLLQKFGNPARMLRIACGTAALEQQLAKDGHDIIGIDTSHELIESAWRRRKMHLSNLRFFHMSTQEMARYLVPGFFNVISCLNDRIIFMRDPPAIKKFFGDCKNLLAPNGTLILHLRNHGAKSGSTDEFEISSVRNGRIRSSVKIRREETGAALSQDIKTGSGKTIPLLKNVRVYPLTAPEIRAWGLEAGFGDCAFFSSFDKKPYEEKSAELVCILR